MVVLGFIHIFWMQVSISSGVWAESLHALQNAPPIRGGMLNDLSDGRIKKKTLFKDKIRLIHGVSKRIRICMYSNCICVFIMLNISWIQHPYIWLQTSNHVYMAFSFAHDILVNKLTNYVHIVFWYQSRIYIYSMLVSLQCYNFIFGPNEYIILISIFSKCIQYKTDQKQSS